MVNTYPIVIEMALVLSDYLQDIFDALQRLSQSMLIFSLQPAIAERKTPELETVIYAQRK